ncbi:MoaD/ThiS family protein [Candidatus Thorarchaeota archaeon]|nr:MAG: MoaD/ThiS family protein [Candidatus Thorarchaeota archaeon]
MSIAINYSGLLASKMATNNDSVDLPVPVRITDLFLHLAKKYDEVFRAYVYDPEKGEMNVDVVVSVNDIPILQMDGLETQLNDGDQIDFLPMFAGGG